MLAAQAIKGLLGHAYADMVPAYTSLTIYFDDTATLEANLRPIEKVVTDIVTSTANNTENSNKSDAERKVGESTLRVIHIPVCYDQSLANDLNQVMDLLQLSKQEIVQRHTNTLYKVHMIGFVPGFAYMGTLDPTLYLPRKKT
ncbi:MAG: carboxyltransferase domain-containing protein, partial [Sphingomonadales bacterium]